MTAQDRPDDDLLDVLDTLGFEYNEATGDFQRRPLSTMDLLGEEVQDDAAQPFAERKWEARESMRKGLLIFLLAVIFLLLVFNVGCALVASGATYKVVGPILGAGMAAVGGWIGQLVGHYAKDD